MTSRAIFGRGFVEEHRFPLHDTNVLVAPGTKHVRVRSFEGKVRALIVIELRRLPAFRAVATRAFRIRAPHRELPGVRVFMASVTSFGRGVEHHILHRHFQVRRLVTVHTRHRAVRPQQREGGGGVIKLE